MPTIYNEFEWVQNPEKPFSEGLAAVGNAGRYFHVHLGKTGYEPAYSERYAYVCSFSEGLAAVRDYEGNCFHIHKDGRRAYVEEYDLVGGFSEGLCVVREKKTGKSFHILKDGRSAYNERYDSAGTFSEGVALVRIGEESFLILSDGTRIDNKR